VTASAGGLASGDPAERSRAVLARCSEHGFALAGIAEARASDRAGEFRAWIAEARHGGMLYLAEAVERRLDPRALVPGARSVLCVADRYADGRPDARLPGHGRIARYARGEDYHTVIRARLESLASELSAAHPGERFRTCVDTAPILEREHAERAGLGRIGKHTLLIGPDGLGSWLLLGVVVSTIELAPVRADGLLDGSLPPDPCGMCTRCIDACPTEAITPWSVDASRCVSALTIEEREEVTGAFAGRTLDWIFGCDTCQEVCPHSQPTVRARRAPVHEAYRAHRSSVPLLEALGWTDADLEAARLNGVLRRASAAMWRRNAALAAGAAIADPHLPRADRGALVRALVDRASDAAEVPWVRDAAAAAIGAAGA
jgi:epoxyqueuosine reductase